MLDGERLTSPTVAPAGGRESDLAGLISLQMPGQYRFPQLRVKTANLANSPFVSCTYWAPSQDTCTAECYAELLNDDET